MRPYIEELIPNAGIYDYLFDKLEILMALSHLHHVPRYRKEVLGFLGRRENAAQIVYEIEQSVSSFGDGSRYPTSGIGAPKHEHWTEGLRVLRGRLLT